MLRNTTSPTMLAAGAKVNVIPSRATATIDGRILPGQTLEGFLAEVRSVVGDGLGIRVIDHHDGTTFERETPLYAAITAALGRHDPEGVPVPYMIPGFTDSFAYARLGAICYGFSPVRLEPGMSFTKMYHGHNERIPRAGYLWGQRVLYELVRDFCAAH
jgi:acetylornithine deacetylase/succinyl-diaminopimelate desuccinylase-like protein